MNLSTQPSPENALQRERLLFRELFDRLINTLLGWLFDLRPERAQRRRRNLVIMFLLSGFLIFLIYYPLNLWAVHIQHIFAYLFNLDYATSYVGNPFTDFINFFLTILTDPRILQYLPIFIAPFFIAQQLAALYLADIFELDDVSVARNFVSEVALTGSDETIRISKGKIIEEHMMSSNYLIGGPGKVIVDLDSVALFEKADGTPHVIGPTGKEPHGKATIEGFERLREAIDIRNHHVELRDQNDKLSSVKSRSRDGIPITATDVQLMFSIDRGDSTILSSDFPYPFSKQAMERIVYQSTSRVTPDQLYPSVHEFNWINNMINLIRGRLGGFMSERKLTEYLASTGKPEFEKAIYREEQITAQVRQLTQPGDISNEKTPKPPPDFTPRYKITDLFYQFADEFTRNARNRGVVLHWIGVGTWKTPPQLDVVSDKHLEAWRLSQENLKNGSEEAMKKAESEVTLQKMQSLIQNVPIDTYYEILGFRKQFNKKSSSSRRQDFRFRNEEEEYDDEEDFLFDDEEILDVFDGKEIKIGDLKKRLNEKINDAVERRIKKTYGKTNRQDGMRRLLLEYRQELVEAVQFMKAKNELVPPVIEEAIKYINAQMGFKHWAGS